MAIKTGSITARPTKYGAKTDTTLVKGFDDFINGTGPIKAESKNKYVVMLYGFDFRALSNLKNVQITDISMSVTAEQYTASFATTIAVRNVKAFAATGSSTGTYTDLGDGAIYFANAISSYPKQTSTKTGVDMPKTLSWIKSNLNSVIEGYSNTTFGIRFYYSAVYLYDVTVTLYYTYEVSEVTVTTAVSPEGAGTVTPTTQTVEEGSTASVTATPNAGYKFSHWLLDGADSGITTTTLSGTVTSNLLCTAVFVLDKINKILCDTSQPKKILIDTQEVKEVYIDKAKVFG